MYQLSAISCNQALECPWLFSLSPSEGESPTSRASHVLFWLARGESPDTPLQTHPKQFLRFHRKFHGQFAKDLLAKTIDDHVHGVLRRQPALIAVKNLILP